MAEINSKFKASVEAACAVLGPEVTKEDLLKSSRLRKLVDARKLVIMYMLENTNITTTHLGKLLRRDHATVIHNYKAARSLVASKDREFINMYYVFKEIIEIEFQQEHFNINDIKILCGRMELLAQLVKGGQRIRYVAPDKQEVTGQGAMAIG